jgi:hypothetical protein
VSAQDLVAAKAKWEGDQRARTASMRSCDLRGQLVQTWGAAHELGARRRLRRLRALVSREQVLLLISLRAGDTLPERGDTIYIGSRRSCTLRPCPARLRRAGD